MAKTTKAIVIHNDIWMSRYETDDSKWIVATRDDGVWRVVEAFVMENDAFEYANKHFDIVEH